MEWIPLLLVAAAAILVVLALPIARRRLVPASIPQLHVDLPRPLNRDPRRPLRWRRKGGLPMDNFVRRLLRTRGEDSERAREANASGAERPSIDPAKFAPYAVRPRSEAVSPERDQSAGSGEPEARDEGEVVTEPDGAAVADEARAYAQVGERVTAVLTSAQAAAEEILSSARADAERTLAEAAERADQTVTIASRRADAMRRDAESARSEAKAYGDETRSSADRYTEEGRKRADAAAAEKLAEAEERAQAIRAAAQRRARHIESEAAKRHDTLLREVERTEGRIQDLLKVFRGMTTQLEALLATETADDALEDALKPKRAAAASADSDVAAARRP